VPEITHQFAEEYMLVERFLLNELTEAERDRFERHMFNCTTCFERVRVGQVFAENISAPEVRNWRRWILAAAGFLGVCAAGTLIFSCQECPAQAVPFVIVAGVLVAMLISVLFRYSERFREFWARLVVDWMQEHVAKSNETKGGM
jgi:putative zinc finger protein